MTLNIVLKIARLVHLILSTLGISIQISEDSKHTWFGGLLGILTFIAAAAQMMGSVRSAANVEQGSVATCELFSELTRDATSPVNVSVGLSLCVGR